MGFFESKGKHDWMHAVIWRHAWPGLNTIQVKDLFEAVQYDPVEFIAFKASTA